MFQAFPLITLRYLTIWAPKHGNLLFEGPQLKSRVWVAGLKQWLSTFFFFPFLVAPMAHEVPRPGIKSEPELQPTAVAKSGP